MSRMPRVRHNWATFTFNFRAHGTVCAILQFHGRPAHAPNPTLRWACWEWSWGGKSEGALAQRGGIREGRRPSTSEKSWPEWEIPGVEHAVSAWLWLSRDFTASSVKGIQARGAGRGDRGRNRWQGNIRRWNPQRVILGSLELWHPVSRALGSETEKGAALTFVLTLRSLLFFPSRKQTSFFFLS